MTSSPTIGPIAPSCQLLALLRQTEGLHRLGRDGLIHPYLCPANVPTQGYGRVVPSLEFEPITKEAAEANLEADAAARVRMAIKLSPMLLRATQGQLDAIADFIYNLGSGRYKASTLKRKVDVGDWEGAKRELCKWVWGGGKKLPGLVLRRETEALMM